MVNFSGIMVVNFWIDEHTRFFAGWVPGRAPLCWAVMRRLVGNAAAMTSPALHMAVVVHLRHDTRTRVYVERLTQEGPSKM